MLGNKRRGFTLIELLLVVTIISLLAVAVFVALNPAQRLKDTKNARRTSDVDTILSAIHQSIIDNKGNYPTKMPAAGTEVQLGTAVAGCAIATGGCAVAATACVDLMLATDARNLTKYLKELPLDPDGTVASNMSGYSVVVDTNGIVTVRACGAEGTTVYASR
ncbi:MAG: hypothetical protein UX91_C0004G0063 [Candidatus Amesbacteria bacterium GW2011_GWB1_47_19]|nr:MAG: hypothetical protein UW51_C0005G0063 [Candidatus Amesbacteria bacterium GW2011_GWA1_44_24]KKU67393.1 MAG: hypothetical protein UX91_C0004G0063 [Candidatus Amesbacteria bacterium GW2011_GWB1_47_19]OGD05389.1 MAG: hypothetical protein A2379_05420 [Candidatus Amesbacteria bacterium RIFOXYB1_FULL_47_13]